MEWVYTLTQAISNNGSAENPLVATLATVDAQHVPAARSVIIRRVADDGTLWFASHAQSQKNSDLRRNSHVALVFWFPTTREQFRISGVAELFTLESNQDAVLGMWNSISESTRATFYWPRPDMPLSKDPDAFPTAPPPGSRQPPETFEVFSIAARVVDHLDLRTHPHTRKQWMQDRDSKEWWFEMLNP